MFAALLISSAALTRPFFGMSAAHGATPIISVPADTLKKCEELWLKMGTRVGNPLSVPVLQKEGYGGAGQGHDLYCIGFRNPSKTDGEYVFGSEQYRFVKSKPKPTVADWSRESAHAARDTHWHEEVFPEDSNLCAAMYGYNLGHREFIEELIANSNALVSVSDFGVPEWAFLGAPRDSTLLARTAFQIGTHYANELLKGSSNRKQILGTLEKLDALGLTKGGTGARGMKTGLHELVLRLKTTLASRPNKRSLEDRVVSDLLSDNYQVTFVGDHRLDPVYKALRSKGLAIFPGLLAHVNDTLLTKSGEHSVYGYIYSVGDICQELIEDISGNKIYRFTTKKDIEAARKWFHEQAEAH